jgi:gamma-D-glutamyl-L-lysine dipeptidyl-peptidase
VSDVNAVVAELRTRHAADPRSNVVEVDVESRGDAVALTGRTTEARFAEDLVAAVGRLLGSEDVEIIDEIVRLPHVEPGAHPFAVARAAVTPVYAEPVLPAPQISQLVMGMRVDVLERTERWLRIRAEDGYLGWVHAGYVVTGTDDWARTWERGTAGEPVVSLGADLADADGHSMVRAPWGARLVRISPLEYELPDGRRGRIRTGEVVDVDRLADWFPLRGESLVRTTRRWLGTPYLWGGVTPSGADCSGFTQAVLWMHGMGLPRDSDQQARTGVPVDCSAGFDRLRAGDLVFFAETGSRISHVGISTGGPVFVHCSLSNGGVAYNDLNGNLELEERLRRYFVEARRLLPD